MGVVEVLAPVRPTRAGGWKVDVGRGERNGRVSSQWFNQPDDERYLALDDLWASVRGRAKRNRSRVVQTADIRVKAARDSAERPHPVLPKAQEPVAPAHWAFGQLARIVGAPASYLRQLPAPLAGVNLQFGLANLAETAAFRDDPKRILIFSDADSTGAQLSRRSWRENQRLRVHYLLEQGWKADAAIQGLGRTNRT